MIPVTHLEFGLSPYSSKIDLSCRLITRCSLDSALRSFPSPFVHVELRLSLTQELDLHLVKNLGQLDHTLSSWSLC